MENRMRHVYETVMGLCTEDHALEGINNLFVEWGECDWLYRQVYMAKRNVDQRLGTQEDSDLELIIGNLLKIMEIVSYEMYKCGMTDGKKASR